MYKCPHCNKPGIPAWRKFLLGPALPTKCRNCGKKVGVSYRSLFTTLIFIIAYTISSFSNTLKGKIVIWAIGIITFTHIWMKYVKLIPKKEVAVLKESGEKANILKRHTIISITLFVIFILIPIIFYITDLLGFKTDILVLIGLGYFSFMLFYLAYVTYFLNLDTSFRTDIYNMKASFSTSEKGKNKWTFIWLISGILFFLFFIVLLLGYLTNASWY